VIHPVLAFAWRVDHPYGVSRGGGLLSPHHLALAFAWRVDHPYGVSRDEVCLRTAVVARVEGSRGVELRTRSCTYYPVGVPDGACSESDPRQPRELMGG